MISDETLDNWESKSKQKSGSAILYTDNTTHNDRIGILVKELRAERKARKMLQDACENVMQHFEEIYPEDVFTRECEDVGVLSVRAAHDFTKKCLTEAEEILKGSGE